MDQHQADNCKCHKQCPTPSRQKVSDADFDKGIWNAAIYNEKERVREFIKAGKSMDRDNCDYTALHYAASKGHKEICQLLIEEGKADVNALTTGGVTALHRAAMKGHLNVVKYLVENKAKLDVKDSDGQTALHRAAIRGNFEVCKYLLEKDSKLKEIKDIYDKIPYEYTTSADDDMKILLKP